MKKDQEEIQVSVIIPAYNAQDFLSEAVDSVLGQTYQGSWELWIIDDASSDQTGQVAEAYTKKDSRIHYYRQRYNCGVAAARNKGLDLSKGRFAAFLDADDWWEPRKLELQFLELSRHKGAALCATGRELMQKDGRSAGKVIEIPEKITYPMLLRTNVIPCGSVLIRRDLAARYRFLHDDCHEDYILWLRLLRDGEEAVGVNRPLLKCRLSQGGKSRNKLHSAKMQYGSYRYIGIGPFRSFYYMLFYMVHGVLKYRLWQKTGEKS